MCTFFTEENWNICQQNEWYHVNYAYNPAPKIIELHFDNLPIFSSRVTVEATITMTTTTTTNTTVTSTVSGKAQ